MTAVPKKSTVRVTVLPNSPGSPVKSLAEQMKSQKDKLMELEHKIRTDPILQKQLRDILKMMGKSS